MPVGSPSTRRSTLPAKPPERSILTRYCCCSPGAALRLMSLGLSVNCAGTDGSVDDGVEGGVVVVVVGTGRAVTLRRNIAWRVKSPLRPRSTNTPELVLAKGGTLISSRTRVALSGITRPVNRSVRFGKSNTTAPANVALEVKSKVNWAVSPAMTLCVSCTNCMLKSAGTGLAVDGAVAVVVRIGVLLFTLFLAADALSVRCLQTADGEVPDSDDAPGLVAYVARSY